MKTQAPSKPLPQKAFVKHPKYRIAELLRSTYGELNMREAIADLTEHCNLKNERTVKDWLKIEAGDDTMINHLVLPKVLLFFGMQHESQLFTDTHNNLLNHAKKIA